MDWLLATTINVNSCHDSNVQALLYFPLVVIVATFKLKPAKK